MTTTTYWVRMKRQMRALCKKNLYQIRNSVWASVCIVLLPGKSTLDTSYLVLFNIFMVVYSSNVTTVTTNVYYDFSTLHQCKNLDAYAIWCFSDLLETVFHIPPLRQVLAVRRSSILLTKNHSTLLCKFLLRKTISSLGKILLDIVRPIPILE